MSLADSRAPHDALQFPDLLMPAASASAFIFIQELFPTCLKRRGRLPPSEFSQYRRASDGAWTECASIAIVYLQVIDKRDRGSRILPPQAIDCK